MVATWLLNKQKDLGVHNDYNIVDTKTDKIMTGSPIFKEIRKFVEIANESS